MAKRNQMTDRQHSNAHAQGMVDDLDDLNLEISLIRRMVDIVPSGWNDAAQAAPCQPVKKRMTIRLDADVFDWYRRLGRGYQNRINKVLRAYMHGVISRHLEDDDQTKPWLAQR